MMTLCKSGDGAHRRWLALVGIELFDVCSPCTTTQTVS